MTNISNIIEKLQLQPHPEGGFYKETYRSIDTCLDGSRNLQTAIYFLLTSDNVSHFHRIKSDEIWFHQDGGCLEIIEIDEHNAEVITRLGKDIVHGEVMQHVVKAGRWFGARLKPESSFCLVACQVSPGFDFRDFELVFVTEYS